MEVSSPCAKGKVYHHFTLAFALLFVPYNHIIPLFQTKSRKNENYVNNFFKYKNKIQLAIFDSAGSPYGLPLKYDRQYATERLKTPGRIFLQN